MIRYFKVTVMASALLSAAWFAPWGAAAVQAEAGAIAPESRAHFAEPAGSVPASEEKTYTGRKISRDFQKTDIREAIRSIAGLSGKNIVISEGVSGKVTLKIKDMPWDQALEAVLASRNLVLEESGNVLMIYDQQTFQRIKSDRKWLPE